MALLARTIDYIKVAMADQTAGSEIIKNINAALAQFASFSGTVSGLSTSVTITANNAGTAGNITLTGDGTTTVAGLISAWNTGHPSNHVTLSTGDGSQVPGNAVAINLTGGAASKRATLSARTQDYVKVAIGDQAAASELMSAISNSGSSHITLSARTQYWLKSMLADRVAARDVLANI